MSSVSFVLSYLSRCLVALFWCLDDADESKAPEPIKDVGKGKDKESEPAESKPPKEKKRVKKVGYALFPVHHTSLTESSLPQTRKVMKVTKDEKGYKSTLSSFCVL